MPPKDLVEPREAAAIPLEDQVRVIQGGAVDEEIGLSLGGEFLEPFPLRRGPGAGAEDRLQGLIETAEIRELCLEIPDHVRRRIVARGGLRSSFGHAHPGLG